MRAPRLTAKRRAEGWTRETIHLHDWLRQPLPPGSNGVMRVADPALLYLQPTATTGTSLVSLQQQEIVAEPEESYEQIEARLKDSFEIAEGIIRAAVFGTARAVIVSGAPGVGKSHTVEAVLRERDEDGEGFNFSFSKGYVKATGLYKMLYEHRLEGQVLVLDDADSIFDDPISLNLLKAVCDSTKRRHVSWSSEYVLQTEDGEKIPSKFDFDGTIIFITNLNFDNLIEKGNKITPHLAALVSRAHYIDLGLYSLRERMIRVQQVAANSELLHTLTEDQQSDVLEFMEMNLVSLREVSLRMAIKLADIRKSQSDRWEGIARMTCLRNKR